MADQDPMFVAARSYGFMGEDVSALSDAMLDKAVNGGPRDVVTKLRSWLADRLLMLAERLDSRYAFRWMSPYTYTFEEGRGIVFREDGRGCSLWYCEHDKDQAWAEADTEWVTS